MDLHTEKFNVIQQIINSDDLSLIKDIKSLLLNRDLDWFDELTTEQQNDVEKGIQQLDNGTYFSHEEAKKRFGLT